MSEVTTTTTPSNQTTPVQMKDLVTKDAMYKMMELLMAEIAASVLLTANEINLDAEPTDEEKSKVPTVEAVYNAITKIGHSSLKFVKGEDGKTFDEMMADKDAPEGLVFYVFKDSTEDTKYDLYVYDADDTVYRKLGVTDFSEFDIDLDEFWSKKEFNIQDYETIEELNKTLEGYIKTEDVSVMTTDEVEEMFNEIKAKMNTSE